MLLVDEPSFSSAISCRSRHLQCLSCTLYIRPKRTVFSISHRLTGILRFFSFFFSFFFCFLLLPFSPISLDGNIKCSLSRRYSLRLLAVLLPFAYVPFFSSVSLYLCNERGPRAHSFDRQTHQKSQPVNYTTTRLIYYNYRGRELKFH